MNTALMITNRTVKPDGLGDERASSLAFFESTSPDLTRFSNWKPITPGQLKERLVRTARRFPNAGEDQNEDQKHISFFIHGYNNDWTDAAKRYQQLQSRLFDGASGLGQLVLFTWPSNGRTSDYLPDREDARQSGPDLASVFVELHDYLTEIQRRTAEGAHPGCRAKVSVIAHSMGNYVLQKALATASKRLNNPQLITLIHQIAMVAADVDNDLFQTDDAPDSDGSLMANLCYRIGALFTGRDQVLGASAGLKHFGKRRLGRSGLADRNRVFDNVFDLDVTPLIPPDAKGIHSAVFEHDSTLAVLRNLLTGRDRSLLLG